jgi:hypothetical protein
MSRRAVSCEHFASLPHLDDVSSPSNPLSRRLMISGLDEALPLDNFCEVSASLGAHEENANAKVKSC